jgi:hypothetical protein
MPTIWEIPLSPRTQKMRVDISGTVYTLHLKFNSVCNTWIMDVNDSNDFPVLEGVPLVTGSDLFGQFRYLGIGGGVPVIVMTIGPGRSPDEIPNYVNLGIDGRVFFKTLV